MSELPTQLNRPTSISTGYRESLWLVALYETEERIHELLARLHALGVETEDASILRVDLNDQIRAAGAPAPTSQLSPRLRNTISGTIIGSAVLLIFGLGLYETGLLNVAQLTGLPAHALLFVCTGALLGALIGAAIKLAKPKQVHQVTPTMMQDLNSDGYLVAVKMPPHLGEQAEAIARGLGAKQILL